MILWCAQAAILLLLANSPAFGNTYLILPFFNSTGSANLDWIGESLSEEVREALVSESLLAFDREDRQEAYRRLSIRPYSHLTKASIIRIGESVDASFVVFGSFTLQDPGGAPANTGRLRIKAQIIDLRKLKPGPEYTELGPLRDLAKLQSRIGWRTLQLTIAEDAPTEEEFRRRQPLARVEALENYVRGLLAANAEQKLNFFTQAVRLTPGYSQANFQLGRLHWNLENYKAGLEALQRVTPADVHYREASFLLGLCRYRLGDFAGAEKAFQVVAESVPLSEVWNNLGVAQMRSDPAAALTNLQKALEGDGADPDYHFNVGCALLRRGDFEAAAERFRAALERDPEDADATRLLGRSLARTPPRGSDPGTRAPERLKENYEESAYLQLKAVLERKR